MPLDFLMQVKGDAEVQSKFKKTGDIIDEVGDKTDKAAKKGNSMFDAYAKAAGGFSIATGGVTSLFFSYGNLEKGQLRVDRAQNEVNKSNLALQNAQDKLNALVEKGITSGPQYEQALLKLSTAQEDVRIKTQQAAQAQGDLSEAQTQFALSVVPTVFSAVTGMREGIMALKDAQVFQRLETILGMNTSRADAGAKAFQTGAIRAADGATKQLTLSTKLLNLAMGPVGIAILGVSTFMALFATNAFGIRDAINAAGKAIGDAIPILRPLLEMLSAAANTLFPETATKAQDFGDLTSDSIAKIATEMPEFAQVSQLSTDQITTDYQNITDKAREMQQLTTASLGLMTDEVGKSITTQTQSFTDLGKAAIDAGNVVAQSFNNAASAAKQASDSIVAAAQRAAAALSSLGVSKASASMNIRAAATGMNETVHRPTLILAGEAGPEHVNITPIGSGSSAGGGGGTVRVIERVPVILEADGKEIARLVNRQLFS